MENNSCSPPGTGGVARRAGVVDKSKNFLLLPPRRYAPPLLFQEGSLCFALIRIYFPIFLSNGRKAGGTFPNSDALTRAGEMGSGPFTLSKSDPAGLSNN